MTPHAFSLSAAGALLALLLLPLPLQAQGLLHTLASPNEEEFGRFGYSVSGVGDLDGDGAGDLLVGAHGEDPGASPGGAGRAYVFSGSGEYVSIIAHDVEDHLEDQLSDFQFFKSLYDLSIGLLFTGPSPIVSDATVTLTLSNPALVQGVRGQASAYQGGGNEWFDFERQGDDTYEVVVRARVDMGLNISAAIGVIVTTAACLKFGAAICTIGDPTVLYAGLEAVPPYDLQITDVEITLTDGTVITEEYPIQIHTWTRSVFEELGDLAPDGFNRMYYVGMLSPADVLMTDAQGRRLGVSGGELFEEVPNAFATGDGDPEAAMFIGTDDPVEVSVEGTGSGTFTLQFIDDLEYGQTEDPTVFLFEDVPVTPTFHGLFTMNPTDGDRSMQIDADGDGTYETTIEPTVYTVSNEGGPPSPPADLAVELYPNPSRDRATIRFAPHEPGFASLTLHDLLGREVAKVYEGEVTSDWHEVVLETDGIAAGVYVLRLEINGVIRAQRMTVIR